MLQSATNIFFSSPSRNSTTNNHNNDGCPRQITKKMSALSSSSDANVIAKQKQQQGIEDGRILKDSDLSNYMDRAVDITSESMVSVASEVTSSSSSSSSSASDCCYNNNHSDHIPPNIKKFIHVVEEGDDNYDDDDEYKYRLNNDNDDERKNNISNNAKQQLHKIVADNELVEYIKDISNEMSSYSRIMNPSCEKTIPTFDKEEIMLGHLLGSGGFNDVYELKSFNIDDSIEEDEENNKRKCLSYKNFFKNNNNNKQSDSDKARKSKRKSSRSYNNNNNKNVNDYAIKFLKSEMMDDEEAYQDGAADLYLETKYLIGLTTSFPHPNIIKIHGVSTNGARGFCHGHDGDNNTSTTRHPPGYFLILDRLVDTLNNRINVWSQVKASLLQEKEMSSNTIKICKDDDIISRTLKIKESVDKKFDTNQMLSSLFIQQLHVARDLSSALKHLHSLNVIFRDLKPDNVGFDANGTVKLFDFGLAREIDPRQRVFVPEDTCSTTIDDNNSQGSAGNNSSMVNNTKYWYDMTGNVGTLRYMAPEVYLNKPYNLSSEVYSFGLLLWQILSLEKPFDYIDDIDVFLDKVINGTERPLLINERNGHCLWSKTLCKLMHKSWSNNPCKRPSMKFINRTLRNQVLSNEENVGIRATATTAEQSLRRNGLVLLSKDRPANISSRSI